LIILKLKKPVKPKMRFHNNPAYYNQFFNQKLKNEEIEKQQYRPQDRLQRTTAFGVPCFTHGSYLENSQFFFKSQLVEIMSDSNCKPLLTEILRDHYRNIICAKHIVGELIEHGEMYLDPKYDKNPEVFDIREVAVTTLMLFKKLTSLCPY
jgi:hypothetical protein